MGGCSEWRAAFGADIRGVAQIARRPALRTSALRPNRTMTLGSEAFAACIDSLGVAAGSVTATAAQKPGGDLTVRIALVG